MKALIRSVEYYLPETILDNEDLSSRFPEWTAKRIEEKLGVRTRHIAAQNECSSDLAVKAAEKLLASGRVSPSAIDYVLFCTQSPDYFLPTTACLIQDRLGIPRTAGALDFNLGCSGYVYGLGLAKGLIESGQARRVLFLTGETYSKFLAPDDKSTRTIFGDAGTATLLEGCESAEELVGPFVYGTDGSGAESLIVKSGGFRDPAHPPACLFMGGPEIFEFTLKTVPAALDELFVRTGLGVESVDCFVFHQANKYMLQSLRVKCGIPENKFMLEMRDTGNTVSNTIPVALHDAIASGRLQPGARVALVGFGVGFSWGACMVRIT